MYFLMNILYKWLWSKRRCFEWRSGKNIPPLPPSIHSIIVNHFLASNFWEKVFKLSKINVNSTANLYRTRFISLVCFSKFSFDTFHVHCLFHSFAVMISTYMYFIYIIFCSIVMLECILVFSCLFVFFLLLSVSCCSRLYILSINPCSTGLF